MLVRVPFTAVVKCGDCAYPLRFGSGFWHRRPGAHNGQKRVTVICGRCKYKHHKSYTDTVNVRRADDRARAEGLQC